MIFLYVVLALIAGCTIFWITQKVEEHQYRLDNDIQSAEDWQNFRRAMTGNSWSDRK